MENLSRASNEIGLFLSSHETHITSIIPENAGILNDFIASYKNYAKQEYINLMGSPEFKNLKSDGTILMGGDALHLSSSYREEHVSGWLKWILEAPILPRKERNLLLKEILSGLARTDRQRALVKANISEKSEVTFETERKTCSGGRLDILINLGKLLVVIENKLWDRSFDKNLKYSQDIKKMFPEKELLCLLLLPEASHIDAIENSETDSFQAFPPVTWEILAQTLRSCMSSGDTGTGKLYWEVLATAFLSFIEANVLGYELDIIRRVLREDLQPDMSNIPQILAYMKYRRIYECQSGTVSE